jgi:hypothetical protein
MTWSPLVHALGDEWKALIGGVPSYPRLAKMQKIVLTTYPDMTHEELRYGWRNYLLAHQNGRAIYASPEGYARTLKQWSGPKRPIHLPYQPVSKSVVETVGQRTRLIQVPLDDPRPPA